MFKRIGILFLIIIPVAFLSKLIYSQEESSQITPPSITSTTPFTGGAIIAVGVSPLMYCANYAVQECDQWSNTNSTLVGQYSACAGSGSASACYLLNVSNMRCPAGTTVFVLPSITGNTTKAVDRRYITLQMNPPNNAIQGPGYDMYVNNAFQDTSAGDRQAIQFSYLIICMPTNISPPYT